MKITEQIIGAVIILTILYFLSKSWKRTIQVAGGYVLYSAWCWMWDNPIWLFFMAYFGPILGAVISTVIAIINNFIFLFFYQKKEVDWLGVNIFEDIKANGDKWVEKMKNHPNIFVYIVAFIPATLFKFLLWLVKKNDIFVFLTLSIMEDSFITTAFLRKKVGGSLTRKDYIIFLFSTIVSCTYWSIRSYIVLIFLKIGWKFLF